MSLAPIDGKLFAFYGLEIFANIFLSIDARGMKTLPFDAYRHGDPNELYFVSLRSLDGEISRINVLELEPSGYFWQVGVLRHSRLFVSYKFFKRFSCNLAALQIKRGTKSIVQLKISYKCLIFMASRFSIHRYFFIKYSHTSL